MKKIIFILTLAVTIPFLLYGILESETYNSIRCGSSLIDLKMPRYEVVHKCGQPQDIMKSSVEIITHRRIFPSRGISREIGVYDYFISSGSGDWNTCDNHDRLMQFYFNPRDNKKFIDDNKVNVTRQIVTPSYTLGDDLLRWQCVKKTVDIETYVYNAGSKNFLRYLTFENGILVKIETGNYGF